MLLFPGNEAWLIYEKRIQVFQVYTQFHLTWPADMDRNL